MRQSLVFLFLIVLFLQSCELLYFEKRRYNSGLFIQLESKRNISNTLKEKTRPNKLKLDTCFKLTAKSIKPFNPDTLIGIMLPTCRNVNHMNEMNKNENIKTFTVRKNSYASGNTSLLKGTSRQFLVEQSKRTKHHRKVPAEWLFSLPLAVFLMLRVNGRGRISRWAEANRYSARGMFAVLLFTIPLLGEVLATLSGNSFSAYPLSFVCGSFLLYFTSIAIRPWSLLKSSKWKYAIGKLPQISMSFSGFLAGFAIDKFHSNTLSWNTLFFIENEMPPDDNPLLLNPVLAVFLAILVLVLLLISLYVVAALSCSIACSGYGIAAIFVFLGGIVASFYAATYAWYHIFMREKDRSLNKKERKQKVFSLAWKVFVLFAMIVLLLIGVMAGV